MNRADSIGYRRAGRALLAVALGAAFGASAQGTFEGGGEVGKGGGYGAAKTFTAAPKTVYYENQTYLYTTGEDSLYLYAIDTEGAVYYKAYDGQAWGEWTAVHDGYAAATTYEPYAVEWGGYENVFWTGADGKVYWNRYDGSAWTEARALTGDGSYESAPYAIGYSPEQKLYAYAVSADGA